MKFPLFRALFTIVLFSGLVVVDYLYYTYKGPIEGQAAVMQLSDSDVEYGAMRRLITGDAVRFFHWTASGLFVLVWGSWIYSMVRSAKTLENSLKEIN